jgi:hypothetical protein
MALAFDHSNGIIEVTAPQNAVDVQTLLNSIRAEEASERGIVHDEISKASGKESLGEGVQIGVTVELLGNWQVHFWPGNYIGKIAGGNLVGGPAGDPVAYSAGVQVLLIQSAASTVVTSSGQASALSIEEHDRLFEVALEASLTAVAADIADLHDEAFGRWTLDTTGDTLTLYRPNGAVLKSFALTRTASTPPAYVGRQ